MSFAALADIVSDRVLLDAAETAKLLSELQIPYALIGGLAVGLHGFPRATKDVDFLVGPEAFTKMEPILVYRPELRSHARIGVIDLMAVPVSFPCLAEQLAIVEPGNLNVIAPEALILMKLSANRNQDRADISRLLDAGVDALKVAGYLADNAPQLMARFAELTAERNP